MVFSPNQIRTSFKKKGFVERKKGKDHCYYFLKVNDKITNIFTMISHTNKRDIGKKLFAKISRDIGVSTPFLSEFVKCDKLYQDLVNELRNNDLL